MKRWISEVTLICLFVFYSDNQSATPQSSGYTEQNIHQGDLIKEAANRVGRSESTGGRWADRWNESGLEGLAPSFGGGRPPKLDEQEQEQLTTDAVFLVDGMDYLMALAKIDFLGDLNYSDQNIVEKLF